MATKPAQATFRKSTQRKRGTVHCGYATIWLQKVILLWTHTPNTGSCAAIRTQPQGVATLRPMDE